MTQVTIILRSLANCRDLDYKATICFFNELKTTTTIQVVSEGIGLIKYIFRDRTTRCFKCLVTDQSKLPPKTSSKQPERFEEGIYRLASIKY